MNTEILDRYNIPGSKTAAVTFLRKNPNIAKSFLNSFGLVNDDDDERVIVRGAQIAVSAIFDFDFNSENDFIALVSDKVNKYRQYIQNTTPTPVTVETVEMKAVEDNHNNTDNMNVNTVTVETVEMKAVEDNHNNTDNMNVNTVTVETVEMKAVEDNPTKKRRGRPSFASQGKTTAYQRFVNWLVQNNIKNIKDRSKLAIQAHDATGIPVASCLVYISTAIKRGEVR
jgi:hypothetical protein